MSYFKDAQRQLTVCNACRYCEGFCAVFPAIERRLRFDEHSVRYLANLCHDCRACYYACPYTPPHEYAINIPKAMSEVRLDTYGAYAHPKVLSKLFSRGKRRSILIGAVSALLMAVVASTIDDPTRLFHAHVQPGGFYAIFPYELIVAAGLALGIYICFEAIRGMKEFWKDIHGEDGGLSDLSALKVAVKQALAHTWFRGGDGGCHYPQGSASYSRLALHASVFFGFTAALVSTILAAIYQDLLGIMPPYPLLSLPVAFGIAGGMLMIGSASVLIYFKAGSDEPPATKEMVAQDYAFLITLNLVSITGIVLLIFRYSEAMGALFVIHMGLVLALFIVAPYGKFVHFVYRFAALVQNALEEQAVAG